MAGATGGVGQLLSAKLLDRGYKVRALSRSQEKARQLLGDVPNLEVVYGETTKGVSSLIPVLSGVDAVCCCTGTTAFPSKRWEGGNNPETVDYVGVKNLVDAVLEMDTPLKRFVLCSSVGVDRSNKFPFFILNAFGVLKYKGMGEKVLESSGIPYTIFRPGRLTDGPYTSYDLNTLLKGIAGTRQDISLSLQDDQQGEASRIAVAEAMLQCLVNSSVEGKKVSLTSKEGQGPGEDASRWQILFDDLVRNDLVSPVESN